MMRGVVAGLVLSCLLLPGVALAQAPADSQQLAEYAESQLAQPSQSYPFVEHHGYFRFRGDMFWNLDLDTQGTSPVLPPLETNPTRIQEPERSDIFDPDAELLAGANIRFRYHPIFHITEGSRIHVELDLLDNLVLGSTPDGFTLFGGDPNVRFDVPLGAFAPGAQPMNEAFTFRESIRVRQAYAEMEFLGLIRVGRMASNWGLGILANHGGSYSSSPLQPRTSNRGVALGGFNCVDCDFGDVVDRFMFVTRVLPTIYVGFLFDWQNQGTASYREDQPLGQAHDLAEVDDVFEVVFTAFRSYFTEREQRERARRLTELNEPIIEGGVYFVLRNQAAEQGSGGGFEPNDTTTPFVPRLASAIIPDIWVRLLWEPAFRRRIRLELEAVAVIGEIENALPTNPDPGNPDAARREIQQFGVAFESDFRFADLTTGLNAGFASGRSTTGDNARTAPGWGVRDFNPVTGGTGADREVRNFKFDRDYFVDMIMFRELIGAITNAIYFNPFVQYNFWTAQSDSMGARLDLIYALPARAEVTPGGEGSIGFEADVMLYYHTATYRASVAYGLFVPGGAFDGRTGRARIPTVAGFWDLDGSYGEDVDATLAHTLQFHLMWAF
jgi:uncharacterized protein (TIGR04551 family)